MTDNDINQIQDLLAPVELTAEPREADDTPRIYVASLSDYNNGVLHGRWVDATQDVDDINEEIQAMLAESPWTKLHGEPAEEYAIHDHDNFAGVSIGEYEDLDRVVEIAQALDGCDEPEAMAAFLANDSDVDPSEFEEAYRGRFDSLRDFAEELTEEIGLGLLSGEQLKDIWSFIDWDHVAREMEIGGDIWTARSSDCGMYVFRSL